MESKRIEEYKKTLDWISKQYELPAKFNKAMIDDFVAKLGTPQSIWGLCGMDVSNYDFSELDEDSLRKLAFNEDTIFPDNYKIDHKRIMDESRSPGLDVYKFHEQGINGSGVNVAIIDKPILETHDEFLGRIKEYALIDPDSEYNEVMQFHGITCAGFLCGNICGVANGANLYYYAYPDYFLSDEMYWDYHFKAFDMIIEHNKRSLDLIKIVSVSTGVSQNQKDIYEKTLHYIDELKVLGCYVITSNVFGEKFSCSIKSPNYDIDNPNTYNHPIWQNYERVKSKVFVPAGGRTSPCNRGKSLYKYCGNQGSFSWAIPYLAGVFTVAMQVKSDLTYNEFCEIAFKTAILNDKGILVINPRGIIQYCSK